MNEKFNLEKKESTSEKPALTMYLLRHGQSEKDKTKANRGLTEKGEQQVTESMQNIIKDLIKENNPDFKNWDDEKKLEDEAKKTVKNIEFHLRDSGTDRTIQQVLHEYSFLKNLEIDDNNIYMPKSIFEYKNTEIDKKAGPGIAKRLKGVQGLDKNPEFRLKLKNPEYRKKVEATGDLMAWAKTPEDEIPKGIEKRSEMETRYKQDITRAERVIKHLIKNYKKRIIVIANSHASIATLAAGQELEIPVDKLLDKSGEMPEAQGLKYDFYKGDKIHKTKAFGKNIEEDIIELKQEK